MNSLRFPSTPARKPRHIRLGHWPHPQKPSRAERKARVVARRRASAETKVLPRPTAAAKKIGFFARLWAALTTPLW